MLALLLSLLYTSSQDCKHDQFSSILKQDEVKVKKERIKERQREREKKKRETHRDRDRLSTPWMLPTLFFLNHSHVSSESTFTVSTFSSPIYISNEHILAFHSIIPLEMIFLRSSMTLLIFKSNNYFSNLSYLKFPW